MSFKAPQPRAAGDAGRLTPSIGGAAARGLFYGRAATRSAGAAGGAAQRTATAAARCATRPTSTSRAGCGSGAFTLGQWAQITAAGTAAAVFGAYLSPLPTRVTIFVAILGAGLPVAVSYGAMGLEFSIGQCSPPRGATGGCRAATRPAPAAPRPATGCCPSRMNPSVRAGRRGSCCGTREARRGAGRGRSVSDRGARPRGAGGHQRGRAGPRAARRAEEPARDVRARARAGRPRTRTARRPPAGRPVAAVLRRGHRSGSTPCSNAAKPTRTRRSRRRAATATGRGAAAAARRDARVDGAPRRRAGRGRARLLRDRPLPARPAARVDWRRLLRGRGRLGHRGLGAVAGRPSPRRARVAASDRRDPRRPGGARSLHPPARRLGGARPAVAAL